MDIKSVSYIFLVLCVAFGILNFIMGGFVLSKYGSVQAQIATTSSYVNQTLSSTKILLGNISAITSSITSSKALQALFTLLGAQGTKINATLSNTNASVSKLNQSISVLSGTIKSQISGANQLVSLAMLGFGIYLILQGVIFILLAVILALARAPEASRAAQKRVKKRAVVEKEEETEKATGKGEEGEEPKGFWGRIKREFGLE